MESGEKILIFSEMFPKAKSSSSGIFIIERLKALQQLGVDFDFAPVSTFDSFSMSLIKRLMGIRPSTPTETVQIGDKQFPVLKVDLGLKERIGLIRQETRSWVKYAEKMAEAIEKRKKVCEFSLLHAHRVFPEGYAAMLLSQKHSIPYVVTAHGSEIHSVSDKNKTVVREILQRAATSIFVSHALMKDASEKLGFSKFLNGQAYGILTEFRNQSCSYSTPVYYIAKRWHGPVCQSLSGSKKRVFRVGRIGLLLTTFSCKQSISIYSNSAIA